MKTNRTKTETKKVEIGFSLLEVKKQEIETNEKIIRLLERRKKSLLDKMDRQKGYALKESEILVIKTNDELAKIHSRVIQDKQQYERFHSSFQDTIEMNEPYQGLIHKDSEIKNPYSKRKIRMFSFWRKCFSFKKGGDNGI